jgi:hypothetical protein
VVPYPWRSDAFDLLGVRPGKRVPPVSDGAELCLQVFKLWATFCRGIYKLSEASKLGSSCAYRIDQMRDRVALVSTEIQTRKIVTLSRCDSPDFSTVTLLPSF